MVMQGEILSVIDGRSIFLLLVGMGYQVVTQGVEPRDMWDVVESEGLDGPSDLVGREVELSEGGMGISFV